MVFTSVYEVLTKLPPTFHWKSSEKLHMHCGQERQMVLLSIPDWNLSLLNNVCTLNKIIGPSLTLGTKMLCLIAMVVNRIERS